MTLTIDDAAALAGVTPHTIRRWVDRGYLRPVRANAKPVMFRESDITECAYQRIPQTRHDALDAIWARIDADCGPSVAYCPTGQLRPELGAPAALAGAPGPVDSVEEST